VHTREGRHDVVRRKVALVEEKIVVVEREKKCGLVAKRSTIITATRASSTRSVSSTPEEEELIDEADSVDGVDETSGSIDTASRREEVY